MLDCRFIAPVVIAATPLLAQDAPPANDADARELLAAAAESWDATESFVADVRVFGTGTFKKAIPACEGRVWMLRTDDGWYVKSFGDITYFDQETEEEQSDTFAIAMTPESSEWVDHATKQVRSGSRINHRSNVVLRNVDQWLLGDERFGDRPDAPSITWTEPYTVGETECKGLIIDNNGEKERWYIADDTLPRRMEVVTIVGSMVYEFDNIETSRPLVPESFVVDVPEGYERVARAGAEDDPRVRRIEPASVEEAVKKSGGRPAPAFALESPDGDTVNLEELRGSVVVLDFWGTWCPPCRASSPEVQKLHEQYGDRGVEVFGLAVRERSREKPIEYFEENDYTYGLLLDADKAARDYKIMKYPTFIVIDQNGHIVLTLPGYDEETTFVQLRETIDGLLENNAGAPESDQG